MVSILRRLRKSLITENKFSKYLIYAFGEIILVVIGILIALSINNWNEARNLRLKESIYLKSLKSDFEQSNLALTRVIDKTARVSSRVDTLITLIKKNGDELTLIQIDTLTAGSSGFTVFMPSEGVINDIISSGKLDMITDNALRERIASWEADLKMIREFEELGKKLASDYNNHTNQYFDLINAKFGKPTFLNDKRNQFLNDHKMTNYMAQIFGNALVLNELYKEKSTEIDGLIHIITKELQ